MPLRLEDFIAIMELPPDWASVLSTEMTTGCSLCGRRLLSTNNAGTHVLPGTHIMRVHDPDGSLAAAYALCHKCSEPY